MKYVSKNKTYMLHAELQSKRYSGTIHSHWIKITYPKLKQFLSFISFLCMIIQLQSQGHIHELLKSVKVIIKGQQK